MLHKLILFIILVFGSGFIFSQQISIDDSFNEKQLVEEKLVLGCITVSNIESKVNGSPYGLKSFAYFERGSSNFPFEKGIMLSTGKATSAVGVNTDLNDSDNSWATDSDIENALGIDSSVNATSIEFDFVSSTNQVQFNYLLASEEYRETFPCDFSDGFAFLIKKAGTNDPYTNIALIPNTIIPVNTNTIHEQIVGFCDASYPEYFDGNNIGDTNFNGRTVSLKALASIIPNETYHIKLVVVDQDDGNYDSAVFIEGGSFIPTVDLGDDIQTCANKLTIDGSVDNSLASYKWYKDDNLIPGQTNPTLNVTQSGTYRVEVGIELDQLSMTCEVEDSINIILESIQEADLIPDYILCDDALADGIELIDLTVKDTEASAAVANPNSTFKVSYFASSNDAQNNIKQLPDTYENISSPQTIYVRIEDEKSGCLAFSQFNIQVKSFDVPITNPSDLLICDDIINDGFTGIDLTIKDDEITNGNTDLVVAYYLTEIDADNEENPINGNFRNSTRKQQLFVNVTNEEVGCTVRTTLNIEVLDRPEINYEKLYIDYCDDTSPFDLNTIVPTILQEATEVDVTFHNTKQDAEDGIKPISNMVNITDEDRITIHIRVESTISGCASFTTFDLYKNLLKTEVNTSDFGICDIDNDGTEATDLKNVTTHIKNGFADVKVVYYLTETDRDSETNPIDIEIPFVLETNRKTLYLTLHTPICDEIGEIDLALIAVDEFDSIGQVTVCDTDQDGFTGIDLTQFEDEITEYNDGFSVRFFISQDDADLNINALSIPYSNEENPVKIYTRIINNLSECWSTNSFEVKVLPAPITNQPSNIVICDDNQDGISIINLQNKIPELVDDTTNRAFSFYTSLNNAFIANSAIQNTTAYPTATTVIYARVENTITKCFSVENINIIINTPPKFIDISEYLICENFSDGFADFFFNTKDTEILNGQEGKTVSYFETPQDAEDDTNEIDKNTAYRNTSKSEQTIYVRVENITDEDCYGTSSFNIKVDSNPVYNKPTDWFVCDGIENDQKEVFDLNEKIIEISKYITEQPLDISFYRSIDDAENKNNALPLQYTNEVNPQSIYALIDGGTSCNIIEKITLNVIQSPLINTPEEALIACDEDYDGINVMFDLTKSEINILNIRQKNLVIDYFETIENLENDTDVISNFRAYPNISNPQIIYVRVTNTISGCFLYAPLELAVNLPPVINDFKEYETCDNSSKYFDLTKIEPEIVNDATNVVFSYYKSQEDAEDKTDALDTDYTYKTNADVVYVRVEFETTSCYVIYPFKIDVIPLPVINKPNDIVACDDNFDGFLVFDLSQLDISLVLGMQNPNNYTITQYNDLALAEEGIDNLQATYNAENNEIIYVRVENRRTGCYSITNYKTIVNPRPIVNIGAQVICLNDLPLVVSANTNNVGDTYLWSTGETTPEIEIETIGDYHVTVTTPNGCVTVSEFNVTESESAIIETIETVDFSDPNNITVTVRGIGNYQYILDDNEPQSSNVFYNSSIGYHTVTIIDLNGCDSVSREVLVIDTPKFMTPNNDGDFDTWHITGVETLPGTIIYIFDRYGKLLKTLTSTSPGWDGIYNGNLMPSDDYWFLAKVFKNGTSFELRGHFAIKR